MTPAGKALILSIATMGLVGLVILAMCLAGLHPPGTAGAFFAGLGLFMIALVPILAVFLMIQNPSLRRGTPPNLDVNMGSTGLSYPTQRPISMGDPRSVHYSSPSTHGLAAYASGLNPSAPNSGLHSSISSISGIHPAVTSSGLHPSPAHRQRPSGILPAAPVSNLKAISGIHPAVHSNLHDGQRTSEQHDSGYAFTPYEANNQAGAPSLFSMESGLYSDDLEYSNDSVSDIRDTQQQDDPFFAHDSGVLIGSGRTEPSSGADTPMDTGDFTDLVGSIESLVGGAASTDAQPSPDETQDEEHSPFEQADTNVYVRRHLQPLLVSLSNAGVERAEAGDEAPQLEQLKMPRPKMPVVVDNAPVMRKTSLRAGDDPWVEEPTGVLPPSAMLALRWASSDEAPLKQEAPESASESVPSAPAVTPVEQANTGVSGAIDLENEMDRMRKALDLDSEEAPEGNSELIKIMEFIDDYGDDEEANSFRSLVSDGLDVEEFQPQKKTLSGGFNSSTNSSIDVPSIGDTQENVFVLLGIGDVGSSRPEALRKLTTVAPEPMVDPIFAPPTDLEH